MLPRNRSIIAAWSLIGLSGCQPLVINIQDCAQEALKVLTGDCCCAGCGDSVRVPVDQSVSPPVARMKVGMTGFLYIETVANDVPKGCLPRFLGSSNPGVEWVTTNPAVLALTQRSTTTSIFVNALAPGEATVYAQVQGVGRVEFAYCPEELGGFQRLDSCVQVRAIVVTP